MLIMRAKPRFQRTSAPILKFLDDRKESGLTRVSVGLRHCHLELASQRGVTKN